MPTRFQAKLCVNFERAVAFFTKGERLADPTVERWVVTARSDDSITIFTQFFGQWPVVGPRHQHMRFSIEAVGSTEVLMRGCTVPDDDVIPSQSSLPLEKTCTTRIRKSSDGVVLVDVAENTNAKLRMPDPPIWACAFIAKKLMARMLLVEAHLASTPIPKVNTIPVLAGPRMSK